MKEITFITGNQSKADKMALYLDMPIKHVNIDLDEIQSLNLREVVEHKAKQAYERVKSPVVVEDTSLEFTVFGRLPGTFIKFFLEELPGEKICALLDGKDRSATARCVIAYYDGENAVLFEGELKGRIAEKPAGESGFGWDKIFIPEGHTVTRASLSDEDYKPTYLKVKPILELKEFLSKP